MIATHPKPSGALRQGWRSSFKESLPSSSTLLLGIFALLLIAALFLAQTILIPMTLAFFLYMVLHPAARILERFHLPKMLAAAVIVLALVGIVAFGSIQLIGPAQEWISNAPDRINKIEQKVENLLRPVEEVRRAAEELGKIGQQPNKNNREINLTDHSFSNSLLSGTQTLLGYGVIIVILLYFLLAAGDNLWKGPSHWCLPKIDNKSFMDIVHNMEQGLSKYLLTVTLINVGVATLIGFAMFLLGMPNPVLWGVMAGLINYVPYLGPLIGEVVVGMVALFTFDDVGHALLAPLSYLCLTFVEGNFVTPMILGRHFTISPLLIILSMIFWGWVWGIIGLFLAVPLLMLFTILCENISAASLKRGMPVALNPLTSSG